MGGLYQSRENKKAYVDKTKEFEKYTTYLMLNMPEKWKDFLTKPLVDTAIKIEELVETANAVYIPNAKQKDMFTSAIRERRAFLIEAYRLFRVYDSNLERLLGQIDLMQSEKKRLKKIMESLIDDAKKSDKDIPEIKIISRMGDVEYRSESGSYIHRLKLTSRQKDHLLKLESEAKTEIRKRIDKDKKYLTGEGTTNN